MQHLDRWLAERETIGARYDERLEPYGMTISGPSLRHLYVVRTNNRDDLALHLNTAGVETKVHWHNGLNTVSGPWLLDGNFTQTLQWSQSVLSLPCYPGLRLDEVDYICDVIETWHGANDIDS